MYSQTLTNTHRHAHKKVIDRKWRNRSTHVQCLKHCGSNNCDYNPCQSTLEAQLVLTHLKHSAIILFSSSNKHFTSPV